MVQRGLDLCLTIAAVSLLPMATVRADATVAYQGYLVQSPFGGPIANGFVVAGTFAPGFIPADYFEVFGDGYGNVELNHYSNAVAAGAFHPIGSPVTTSPLGFFMGTGSTTVPQGASIYLFAFARHPDLGDFEGVIATSSNTTFKVPAAGGTTSIDAALANIFVFGASGPQGAIALGMLPIPEPSAFALWIICAVALGGLRRRDQDRP